MTSGSLAQTDSLTVRFDKIDNHLNNGMGYTNVLGNTSGYAWGESYVLSAYIDMYRATGDTLYLDKLVEQFDRVLANRDDARHINDYYRKAPIAGWGSTEYSKGKWHTWLVHTGMICQGPADFVQIVRAEGRLKKYAAKADLYLQKIKESVSSHEPDWRNGPGKDEGYYVDPEIGPLPVNQQNAMGSVLVSLYHTTRDHFYRDKASQLARFMQKRLRKRPDGSFDWSYWPRLDGNGRGSEDISHAAININFAVRCRAQKIVFSNQDMDAFALTWTHYIRRSAHEFADNVDGKGGTNTHSPQAVGRWMDLSMFNHAILEDGLTVFGDLADEKASGADLLGIAKLAHYRKVFDQPKRPLIPRIKLLKKRHASLANSVREVDVNVLMTKASRSTASKIATLTNDSNEPFPSPDLTELFPYILLPEPPPYFAPEPITYPGPTHYKLT